MLHALRNLEEQMGEMNPIAEQSGQRRTRRFWIRHLGTALIIIGLGVVTWSFVVWRWNDPVTSLYTTWQQKQLRDRFDVIAADAAPASAPLPATSRRAAAREIKRTATAFGSSSGEGEPIGRLIVPRLALDAVVVNGTDTATLRKGPGRDLRTYLPGQGELVYIAGHRTTYAAPFSHIDRLRPGDVVKVLMPYGTFTYAVTNHTIVPANDLSVLRSPGHEVIALQACHPRFFATERYIVWARPVGFIPRGGRSYSLT